MKNIPVTQTVLAVAGIAILCGLGTWQVQRLTWKNGIIQTLQADYAQMQSGSITFTPSSQLEDLADIQAPLTIGKIRGRFLREEALLLGPRTLEGRAGYHLLIPVELQNGKVLIANTGWVDALWQDNFEDRLSGLPAENIILSGVIRKPDWSSFASKNSPANNLWLRPDIDDIAAAKGLNDPYPYMIYVSKSEPVLDDVIPIEENWLPRNKHLQYALFWYAMAVALAGVFGFYIKSRKA